MLRGRQHVVTFFLKMTMLFHLEPNPVAVDRALGSFQANRFDFVK